MSQLDDLERLNRLREQGALTDPEFEVEKNRILTGTLSPVSSASMNRERGRRGTSLLAASVLILIAVVTGGAWLLSSRGRSGLSPEGSAPASGTTAQARGFSSQTPAGRESRMPAKRGFVTSKVAIEALLSAMRLNATRDGRAGRSGEALRKLIAAGVVKKRPDTQADYVDTRTPITPIFIFGLKVIDIEEEHLQTPSLGCCADPGVGVKLLSRNVPKELREFAQQNKCEIDSTTGFGVNTEPAAKAGFENSAIYVSCRESDLRNSN